MLCFCHISWEKPKILQLFLMNILYCCMQGAGAGEPEAAAVWGAGAAKDASGQQRGLIPDTCTRGRGQRGRAGWVMGLKSINAYLINSSSYLAPPFSEFIVSSTHGCTLCGRSSSLVRCLLILRSLALRSRFVLHFNHLHVCVFACINI